MHITENSINPRSWAFYLKGLLFGVLVFAGVAGGVYVGNALSKSQSAVKITPELFSNSSYLAIDSLFPNHELVEFKTNEKIGVRELVKQGPTLLVFLSTTCDACRHLAQFFNSDIVEKLDKDIHIAVIFDSHNWQELDGDPEYLKIKGSRIFLTDREKQSPEDGINVMPSLIGLNSGGEIRFIMTGFNRRISADFLNEYVI